MFEGSTVVVTGGARSLGLALARHFCHAGAHVVIGDLDHEAGRRGAEALRAEGMSAAFQPLDVRDPQQSRALVQSVAAERGAIDVWVNNAGVSYAGPAERLLRDAWDDSVATMLSGAFYCAQAAGSLMLERGQGVIVNVASVTAFKAIEGWVAVSAAKAGLVMLTQALAVEWAGRGVRVVGIAPGMITTGTAQQDAAMREESRQIYERRTPLRRLGTEAEIAEAVLFLASDEASFIVGETLRVDGGWVAYHLF